MESYLSLRFKKSECNTLLSVVNAHSTQDHNWRRNELVHLVKQVTLYQTTYVSYLVHSVFLFEFFLHSRWLLLHTVRQKFIEKLEGIFWTSIDSDAVFHEESEYVIGLMIWLTKDDVSSVFRRHLKFFSCKKTQKMTKIGKSISTVYQWR